MDNSNFLATAGNSFRTYLDPIQMFLPSKLIPAWLNWGLYNEGFRGCVPWEAMGQVRRGNWGDVGTVSPRSTTLPDFVYKQTYTFKRLYFLFNTVLSSNKISRILLWSI